MWLRSIDHHLAPSGICSSSKTNKEESRTTSLHECSNNLHRVCLENINKPTFIIEYANFSPHYTYTIKKDHLPPITLSQSGNLNVYKQEMVSIKNTLRNNNCPTSITSASLSRNRRVENNNKISTIFYLQYISSTSEKIQNICSLHNNRIIFKSYSTFW